MKKTIFALALALSLLFCLAPAASAVSDDAAQAAQSLYERGLFKGTGTNTDGTPIFALDKTPTRNQAIIMLVRLLGKEDEALAGTWNIPFTDVSDSMKPYIGYAYANGLTNGTSATTYSGTNPIRANQYVTFVLRALGYESGKDFTVSDPWTLAASALGVGSGYTSFSRGDVAVISQSALYATVRDGSQTLFEKLKADGTVTATAELPQQLSASVDEVPSSLTFKEVDSAYYGCWGSPLASFKLQSLSYAVSGDYAYFRMQFQDNAVTHFFVQPVIWGQLNFLDASVMGEAVKLTADAKSGVFTCRVPLKWFEEYSELLIGPSEDGGKTGPGDYIIRVGYLLNNVDTLTFRTAEYTVESSDASTFQLGTVEYAEVPGGRLYRLTFTSSAAYDIQFWPVAQHSGSDRFIWRTDIQGKTTALCFVSNTILENFDLMTARVRNFDYTLNTKISVYFDGIPSWKK